MGLIALLGMVFAHDPHDEDAFPHDLAGKQLCIDDNSVVIQLEQVATNRAGKARTAMLSSINGAFHSELSQVPTSFEKTCQSTDAYVTVSIHLSGLDANRYKRYGQQSYGYALSVQVGQLASQSFVISNHVLPELRFLAFEEQVHSEAQTNITFENDLKTRVRSLLQELAGAWHEDNP